jgi:ABC-type transport system involved in multi-copper enzyme maturation permease subunit
MRDNLAKIHIIASYTFREVYRSRILLNVVFTSLGLSFLTYIASEFTYGVPGRVALDFGLGTISLSAVFIALFLGVTLMSREIENRTVYMVLSRPLPRWVFLVGRCLGLYGMVIVNTLLLSFITLLATLLVGGHYSPLIPWSLLFSLLEAGIILMAAVCFSMVTNTVMAVLYGLSIFILGHSVYYTSSNVFAKRSPVFSTLLEAYSFVFPDLSRLNIKDFILYKQSLPNDFLFSSLAYGVIYIIILFILGSYLFGRKSLD